MKKNLKTLILPSIYLLLLVCLGLISVGLFESFNLAVSKQEENYDFISDNILFNKVTPVIKEVDKPLIKPFTDETVLVVKDYYDYNDKEEEQEKSIIYYDNTYIQNQGVSYGGKTSFNCLSVLDGEVIDVSEDDLMGKSVIIRHNEELISVYKSLSEVNVNINDKVNQGDVIGVSGENKMEQELNNHLHFELIYKNVNINPENYYGKKVGE